MLLSTFSRLSEYRSWAAPSSGIMQMHTHINILIYLHTYISFLIYFCAILFYILQATKCFMYICAHKYLYVVIQLGTECTMGFAFDRLTFVMPCQRQSQMISSTCYTTNAYLSTHQFLSHCSQDGILRQIGKV